MSARNPENCRCVGRAQAAALWTKLFRARFSAQVLGPAALAFFLSGHAVRAAGFDEPGQSTLGQGASNAGVAAGGSLSSMFWNPATITQSGRFAAELGAFGILPHISQQGSSTILPLGSAFSFTSDVGNSVLPALVPNGYLSQQIGDRLWAGLSINAPFGLADRFPNPAWAGAFYGQNASLKTYNIAPTIAIKLTDWIRGIG
jgi:long-chain fatty acid transport protein